MSQVVYYGCWDNKLLYDLEPLDSHTFSNIFNTPGDRASYIHACPAFKDAIKNTFIVKSPFTYTIDWDGNKITSPMYDKRFFDDVIKPRTRDSGFLSYKAPKPVFIAEGNDLNITEGPAYFHNNDITNKSYMVPGSYNIGKHILRPLELAMKFKTPGTIKITEGDALYYIKFHTEEEIIFKKFVMTPDITNLCSAILSTREYTNNFKSIKWWYSLVARHNFKNYILKKIKQNLL